MRVQEELEYLEVLELHREKRGIELQPAVSQCRLEAEFVAVNGLVVVLEKVDACRRKIGIETAAFEAARILGVQHGVIGEEPVQPDYW